MKFLPSMQGAESPLRHHRRLPLNYPTEFRNQASLEFLIRTSYPSQVDRHLFPESSPVRRPAVQIRSSSPSNHKIPASRSARFPSSSNIAKGKRA